MVRPCLPPSAKPRFPQRPQHLHRHPHHHLSLTILAPCSPSSILRPHRRLFLQSQSPLSLRTLMPPSLRLPYQVPPSLRLPYQGPLPISGLLWALNPSSPLKMSAATSSNPWLPHSRILVPLWRQPPQQSPTRKPLTARGGLNPRSPQYSLVLLNAFPSCSTFSPSLSSVLALWRHSPWSGVPPLFGTKLQWEVGGTCALPSFEASLCCKMCGSAAKMVDR